MGDCALDLASGAVHRFSVFFADQSARYAGSQSALDECLDLGLIECAAVICEGAGRLSEPFYTWHPDDPLPRFESLASRCRCREFLSVRERKIYFATERAVDLFGGVAPHASSIFQIAHDVSVVEILIALRECGDEAADRWVSEALFAHRHAGKLGDYVPDAAIFKKSGELERAIEFGGRSYTPDRFREIHAACSKRHIPYEVW